MAKKIKVSKSGLLQVSASTFEIAKAVLALTADEATDIVTASANCPGAAYFEFNFGSETGVYTNGQTVPSSKATYQAQTNTVFARVRGVDASGNVGEWSDEAEIAL